MTNVPKLEKLHLGGNKLSGNIPSSISNASMLKILELEDNFLSGIIPNVLGDLRHLEWFQISNNSLTTEAATHEWDFLSSLGHIPESFGGLISLRFLDLSNNNLSEFIPKSLEKLSSLKYFNVSFNRLEGEIPTKGCFPNFSSTSFMNNYALCGPPRLLVPPCNNSIHKNYKMAVLHDLKSDCQGFDRMMRLINVREANHQMKQRKIVLKVKTRDRLRSVWKTREDQGSVLQKKNASIIFEPQEAQQQYREISSGTCTWLQQAIGVFS
ncbi:hypothetical protein V6N13_118258 [Hibiscus sabdariffa]